MNTKTLTKVIAAFLAFILSFANVALLGSYKGSTYAASTNLETQDASVKNAEIEFDAYFQENGENVHTKNIDMEGEETLYLSLKVKNGYLQDAKVKVENANFKLQETSKELDKVQSISSEDNSIILNQINKDETVILEIPVKIAHTQSFAVSDLSKVASIKLEGTYLNNKGKDIKIEKTIEVETTLDGTAESDLSQEITKYVPFEVSGEKGVILQTLTRTNLIENKLPVKSTELEIEIPVINKIEPKEITVSAKTQMATNGRGVKVFNNEDYVVEDGKIKFTIENDSEILSWAKNAYDEILVTYIYDENAIVQKTSVELKAKSKITYYAEELRVAEKESKSAVELEGKIGELVTLELNTAENTLYKGYMLNKSGKNTTFTNTVELNIGYSEIMDKIVFKDETKYVDEKENKYPANVLYKTVKISEENLKEILGEDGFINVLNSKGEIITTLNKEKLEYTFEQDTYGIIFETSNVNAEGILKLETVREIISLEYSKAQEEMFTGLNIALNADIINNEKTIIKASNAKQIDLVNPETKASLNLSTSSLSTVVTNEGVEIRVELNTKDASSALYKNPEVSIELPKYIIDVNIENVKLLYEKELKLQNARMYKNESGNIVINITLNGEQTAYNENWLTEGATLIMNADIKVNEIAPTSEGKVVLTVKNENAGETVVEQNVKFIAPAGIATISQISGYNAKGETATSISGETEVGEMEKGAPARTAKVRAIAVNNYTHDCDNIVILGRTPSEGNKKISNNEELRKHTYT